MKHDTYETMHGILRKIILDDHTISEAEAKEKMWDQLQKDTERYFRLLYDNWFNVNWRKYEPEVKEVVTERPGQAPLVGQSVTLIRKRSKATHELKQQRKVVARKLVLEGSSTILMNLPMANGRALRDCTGSECARFGGWFADIAKVLKPNQKVGSKLSEIDLQNLYARNKPRAA